MKTPEQKQIESLTKQRDELSEAAFVLIGDPMLGETSGSTSSTNMFVTFSALRRVRAAIAAAKPVKATSGYLEQPLRTEAEARAAAENQRGDDDG